MRLHQPMLFFLLGTAVATDSTKVEPKATKHHIRSRQLTNCENYYPDDFCISLGGDGARAKSGRNCYDTWDDCYCKSGYEEYHEKCVKEADNCSHNPDYFCSSLGGSGAIPKHNRNCYDTWDDCTCKYGYVEKNNKCVEEDKCSDYPDSFCYNLGGPGAIPISGRNCYDTWDDCKCKSGYEEKNNKCVEKDNCSDYPETFCYNLGGQGAVPIYGRNCYDTWDDCRCKDGYIEKNNRCEKEDDCSDYPEHFCSNLGGPGAIPISGRTCYDTFDDCKCKHGYVKKNDKCVDDGCSEYPEEFCRQLGGHGAIPKYGRDCYDTWDDCKCKDGYEMGYDKCEMIEDPCNKYPEEFCRHLGGEGAVPIYGQSCYDTWGDCKCKSGYHEVNNKCEPKGSCSGYPDTFCYNLGGSGAIPIDGRKCYDTFDDCYCKHGYIKKDNKCVIDNGCKDPDQFCRDKGGDGAFPVHGYDCYDSFTYHCDCFDGYSKQDGYCKKLYHPEDSYHIQHVGNDKYPSHVFPLGKCQGDCDGDHDCRGNLICHKRDGHQPVPGCSGGESEPYGYDYCIDPY